jgi:hypothetical protein
MALNNLTGQNIQDTYQKVVQTDGTNLADGTGSLLPISFNGNDVIISGSLTAHQYIVSSSVTNITIATLSGSTTFGDSTDDTHTFTGNITASGNISASGTITATSFTGSLQGTASTASIATTVTLTATNATNAAHFLTFTDAATGNENVRTDTSLTYNPFSNTLTTGPLVATTVSATTVSATTVGASIYQYNNSESLTAGGVSQGNATPITRSGPIFVTGVTGRGIILPRWSEDVYILTIHNMSLTNSFLLYPYFGESIGTLATNLPATVPAGGSIILTSGGPALKIWQGYLGNNTDGTITATSINGTINGGTF